MQLQGKVDDEQRNFGREGSFKQLLHIVQLKVSTTNNDLLIEVKRPSLELEKSREDNGMMRI